MAKTMQMGRNPARLIAGLACLILPTLWAAASSSARGRENAGGEYDRYMAAAVSRAYYSMAPVCARIPADYTGDCRVDFDDFTLLADRWLQHYSWNDLSLLAGCWLADATAGQNATVSRVYPDKARYNPGDTATITVELASGSAISFTGTVTLTISRLGRSIFTTNQTVALAANGTATLTFTWPTPMADYRGYMVEAWLNDGSFAVTAIDVASDWRRYPRYGYITEFYQGQSSQRNTNIVDQLARDYHVNCVQFYDWMWRHESVIQRSRSSIVDPWTDWRGAHISYAVLRDMVAKAHDRNIAAMPYFQIYVGLDGYEQTSGVSPQWGLFSDPLHTNQFHHTAGSTNFWVFNPIDTNWQNYLLGEYTDALLSVDFDGVHLDQLGNIGGGVYYDYSGNLVDLGNSFSPMLNLSKNHLDHLEEQYPNLVGHDAVTFNIVDGDIDKWGVNDVVRNSRVDFLYSELWSNDTYRGVLDFVKRSRTQCGDKAMVLAAYINRYEDTGGYFDDDSVRLADAAFSAAGAFHIELGDGDQMLGNEFFPNRSKLMSPELKSAMKDYYDFITAYEVLLFAPELVRGDTGLQWISIAGQPLSGNAAGDTLWFLSRHTAEFEVLHLINLLGNDEQWRNIASAPPVLTNLSVKYRLGATGSVKEVYLASPDLNHGIMRPLPYYIGSDPQGDFVSFMLPVLRYWDMIYFEREIAAPPANLYQAENAIKSGVSVNTNHPGYSGTGFVDQFNNVGDSVSFVIATPVEKDYSLQFCYANAAGATATRQVFVDGDYAGNVSFQPLANWDTWAAASLGVRLRSGVHQVVLYFGGGNTVAINLDYLQVTSSRIQAETADGL